MFEAILIFGEYGRHGLEIGLNLSERITSETLREIEDKIEAAQRNIPPNWWVKAIRLY